MVSVQPVEAAPCVDGPAGRTARQRPPTRSSRPPQKWQQEFRDKLEMRSCLSPACFVRIILSLSLLPDFSDPISLLLLTELLVFKEFWFMARFVWRHTLRPSADCFDR